MQEEQGAFTRSISLVFFINVNGWSHYQNEWFCYMYYDELTH